jgi:hypothetical protein
MLKGKQKKLDKNKDGKISGEDFKMMKAKIGKIAAEEKYSTVEFGKTYHPITQSQMSNNIRKNFEGDKKFASSNELDDAHEKLKKNLSDKNVRPSEILKLDKEYKARKERAIKTVQKDLSSRPEMKELRKKTKGTVTDTGSTYSKGGAARTSGMGLQDENLIPGKVQKAFLGLMAVKKAKDKGAKGAEFLSPAAMLKRMLSKKKGGVAKGEMMKARYGTMAKGNVSEALQKEKVKKDDNELTKIKLIKKLRGAQVGPAEEAALDKLTPSEVKKKLASMSKAKHGKMMKAKSGKDVDIDLIEKIANESIIGKGPLKIKVKKRSMGGKMIEANIGMEAKSNQGYGAARTSGMGLQDEDLIPGKSLDYYKDIM